MVGDGGPPEADRRLEPRAGHVSRAATDGERVARRGGGGLVTALRSLVSHHDVTWIASAMTDEDRAVADEAGGAAIEEHARDGSPFRLRLVAHDATAYDWFYNVVSNPMLWFLQHYLWELAYEPSIDIALQHAWDGGYAPVNETFAEAVLEELEARARGGGLLPRLPPLPRAAARPRRARRTRCSRTSCTSRGRRPTTGTCCPDRIRRAIHDGLLANDVVGFHTHRWRLNFLRAASDLAGADARLRRRRRRPRRAAHARDACTRSRSTRPSSTSSPRARRCSQPSASSSRARPEKLDPARRPDRSVEEHRARLPRLRALPRRASRRCTAASGCSRCSTRRGRTFRSTRSTSARSSARRGASTTASSRTAGRRSSCRIAGQLPGSVAAYKQFDVLLVNAIFDGMNLVAKEAPLVNERDGVLILSENAGAHEELGEWALTVNPFDVAGQAEAIHTALDDGRVRAARAARRRSARTCASTT